MRVWYTPRCESGNYVAVARDGNDVLIRDSKDQDGPILRFTLAEWRVFVRDVAELDGMLDSSC